MEVNTYLDKMLINLMELESCCGGFKPDSDLRYATGGLGRYQRDEIKNIMNSLSDVKSSLCCLLSAG